MPRQGRTGHVPVSRGYLCHEQKRCQWADFLEETVHGMCQASAGAASCTAAEIRQVAVLSIDTLYARRVPVVDVHMRQDGPHHDEAAEQPVDDHA